MNAHSSEVLASLRQWKEGNLRSEENVKELITNESITASEIYDGLLAAAYNRDREVLSAVFNAAENGNEETRRKVFEAKSMTNDWGEIPGFIYNKYNLKEDLENIKLLKLLLEGIDLEDERYNTNSGSALHYAVANDNKLLIEYLIETKYPLNRENAEGLTTLNRICIEGPDWAGVMLLEAGIDVNHRNSKKLTSLEYSVKYHRMEMFRSLIKFGAGTDEILKTAVESGNYEVVNFCWDEPKFKADDDGIDGPTCLAAKYGHLRMLEMFVEKGYKVSEAFFATDMAIVYKQVDALEFLLNNGAKLTPGNLSIFYGDLTNKWGIFYGKTTDKDAGVTLPTILKFWGLIGIHEIKPFIAQLIKLNFYRCTEIFIKYVSDNPLCNITELVLSASEEKSVLNLLELAGRDSEETFIVLLKYTDLDQILSNPKIYHILLSNKHYRGLKELMDKSVILETRKYQIKLKFLSSIEYKGLIPDKDAYPKESKYSHLAPSFLHKLNNCPDPWIKFHPLVNAAVEKKLRVYRWWYVLTFALYCIFLAALYYALFQSSYQCDGMLFSYTGSSGAFRALCELVVVIYALIFSLDECMEFIFNFIRFSVNNYQNNNLLKVLREKEFGEYQNLRHFVRHLPSLLKDYFGVFNIVDILGLVFLFLLIIFRLASSPFQWTLASFTIILFTLRLFKYTRIIPSLGAYVKSIFQIFINDITQFAAIVLIILLAYFGGIHLAARQTFTSRDSTTPLLYPAENCSNNSFTGLFWFDQERTGSYDLRRPLLSGIIFLLDGGPGNEETGLLDSNFLFTLLYLAFAFTLIVVMSNILIAQLSQTYAEITKNSDLPFKLDLVVSVEYESNLAFFFGKRLRLFAHSFTLHFTPLKWNAFVKVDPQEEILLKIEDNSSVITTRIDNNLKEIGNDTQDIIKKRMDVMEDKSEKRMDIMEDKLEKRMDIMEDKLEEVLSLLKQLTPVGTDTK